MTFLETEMKELGRSTQQNIHNARSLIRAPQEYRHPTTHTSTHPQPTHTHTHTHTHTQVHAHKYTHTHTHMQAASVMVS